MKKIYYNEYIYEPIGNIIVASLEDKTVYIDINGNHLYNYALKTGHEAKKDINSNRNTIIQIKEYLSGERKQFEIATDFLTGTDFQKKVWKELANIPYGTVINYKKLAENINKPGAYRAVGNANSKNPIPIIFPCHRVINANGKLGGFSCGIEIKRFLLDIELKF